VLFAKARVERSYSNVFKNEILKQVQDDYNCKYKPPVYPPLASGIASATTGLFPRGYGKTKQKIKRLDSRPGFASDFAKATSDKKASPRQVKALILE